MSLQPTGRQQHLCYVFGSSIKHVTHVGELSILALVSLHLTVRRRYRPELAVVRRNGGNDARMIT
jgi:hypothetical protein